MVKLGGQGPQLLNNRITNIEQSNIEVKIFRKRKNKKKVIRNLVGVHGFSVSFSLKLGHLDTWTLGHLESFENFEIPIR